MSILFTPDSGAKLRNKKTERIIMNSYEIIDAHCHIYPQKIALKAVHATDLFYEMPSASPYDGTTDTLLAVQKESGISRFIVQSVATTPHQVHSINTFVAAEVAAHPDTFTGLGTLHPDSEHIEEDVEEIISLGLHGVKLHPDIQKFAVDDKKCLPIYECCRGRLPILMHTGDKRYDFSNPNRLLRVLHAFPDLTILGAHLGGWSIWEEASMTLTDIDNLYVDTSSTIGFIGFEKARECICRFPPEKLLFGTDYPMWRPQDEVAALLDMGFSDAEYQKIFSENAKRVFGIR